MIGQRKRLVFALVMAVLLSCIGGCWAASTKIDMPWPYTKYSDGYSRSAFNSIAVGDSANKVEHLLGTPMRAYHASNVYRKFYPNGAMVDVHAGAIGDKSVVTQIVDPNNTLPAELVPGVDVDSVSWEFAEKLKSEYVNEQVFWHYSESTESGDFYQRRIIVLDRTGSFVVDKVMGFPWDEFYWFLDWEEFCMWLRWG